jgi:SAM-dependent methyltransferase
MNNVQDHYSKLLAKHYTWMFGTSFEAKVLEQRLILEDALQPVGNSSGHQLAVDLGCGPGFQAIALAEMGYSPVLAIDTSEELLNSLRAYQGARPIKAVCDDLLMLPQLVAPATAQVIVCMGDTITHLDGEAAVEELLSSVMETLSPGGSFVISYRDLSATVAGLDRFIPVYSDENKVMTCFLEFDRPESVLVHDLVYSRDGARWLLEKSSYRKLRLPVDWLEDAMVRAGFQVRRGHAGRLLCLIGRK